MEEKIKLNQLSKRINHRNWIEDFNHENGQYQNRCIHCGELFIGHKRRVICKYCSVLRIEIKVEKIRGKYYATFKHSGQKFIVLNITGNKEDAEFTKNMLVRFFSKCPRCNNIEITINGDKHYCCKCGSSW